ncbi:HIRAN domain-containing protein [Paenibacillus sp. TAB 01]|uniref:HIRAN domain-containing protein n=1 Tax=Paenibacillus sp. TAB 01 TaxID=3368988 RepID=UPI003752347F
MNFFKWVWGQIIRTNDKSDQEMSRVEDQSSEYKEFEINVAGVTHKNNDGSSRKKIASSCHYGQKLILVRELDNPYDKNAVKIMTESNKQLGYVDAWNAKDFQAILKGTSRTYSHIECAFIESGMFKPEDEDKLLPYCTVSIKKYYKNN